MAGAIIVSHRSMQDCGGARHESRGWGGVELLLLSSKACVHTDMSGRLRDGCRDVQKVRCTCIGLEWPTVI